MIKQILAAVFALAALGPVHPRAQATAEDSVRAVVVRLFDGMRTRDSAAVRAAFAPGARLQSALVRQDGTPVLREDSLDAFVRAVGEPGDVVWDEQLDAVQVRIDGPLAVVTADYTFFAGPRLSHCGIDAFQLFRGPEGWKIFQLTDTRRRTGCRAEIGSSPP
ncbi:MAG TPA: nuclear transport factor 2 family protein [Longimicrobium sp.]